MPNRKTLLEIVQGLDPNGHSAKIMEVLNEKAPILSDAHAMPSNAQMGNRVTIRTSLPGVGRVRINQGIAPTKSSKMQRTDTIGIYAGRSEIDRKLLFTHGQAIVNAERYKEERAFVESLAQTVTADLLYGNEKVDSAGMTGFMPRLASLASSFKDSVVMSMGSVTGGDGTSILVVDWGEDGAHLIYPRDGEKVGGEPGMAGLRVEAFKEPRDIEDAQGNRFLGFITEFHWFVGLSVEDPRRIARLANIDVSDANLASPTQGLLHDKMIDLLTQMPPADGVTRVIYVPRVIEAAWMKQLQNKSNVWLTMAEYNAKQALHFWGYPVRSVDRFSVAESTVT